MKSLLSLEIEISVIKKKNLKNVSSYWSFLSGNRYSNKWKLIQKLNEPNNPVDPNQTILYSDSDEAALGNFFNETEIARKITKKLLDSFAVQRKENK